MLTLESVAHEYRRFHNHICVVHDCELVRLIGVAESPEDYYYKAVRLGGKVGYYSTVGSCVSLKECYPDPERYATLDKVFGFNRAQPTQEFEIEFLKS